MSSSSGLPPAPLARNLAARGFSSLTSVQSAVLEAMPQPGDLLVCAPTGSGKTLAFGIAIAARLLGHAGEVVPGEAPRALVVVPTRDLAAQVHREFLWLFAGTGARIACCTGGTELRAERALLAAGADMVVGTPGRLRDHVEAGALRLGEVGLLVLDEADDLLTKGFRPDLDRILAALPRERRLLLFSATMPPRAEELARRLCAGARMVAVRDAVGAPGGVALQGVAVPPGSERAVIARLLRYHAARAALVFCPRRAAVTELADWLAGCGLRIVSLSGALSRAERVAALAGLRAGSVPVCVATDLAARGLDLPNVDLVIHAGIPQSPETLLHRCGRTGRAGRSGLAILVVGAAERAKAERFARRAGLALEWRDAPDEAALLARDHERMLKDPALGPAGPADHAGIIARLIAAHSPEALARAYARLWRALRPVLPI